MLRQFATDDWLLNVNDATSFVPDFYGGRLPADDLRNALDVVNVPLKASVAVTPARKPDVSTEPARAEVVVGAAVISCLN